MYGMLIVSVYSVLCTELDTAANLLQSLVVIYFTLPFSIYTITEPSAAISR